MRINDGRVKASPIDSLNLLLEKKKKKIISNNLFKTQIFFLELLSLLSWHGEHCHSSHMDLALPLLLFFFTVSCIFTLNVSLLFLSSHRQSNQHHPPLDQSHHKSQYHDIESNITKLNHQWF